MADIAIKSDAQFGYITVKLEYGSPVELNSFVKSLAGLAREYERFAKSNGVPAEESKIYLKEVRKGSIVAELVPHLREIVAASQPLISSIDSLKLCKDFIVYLGASLEAFRTGDKSYGPYTKSQLNAFKGLVQSVAEIPGSKAKLTAKFQQTPRKIEAEISFDTHQSSQTVEAIDVAFREIDDQEANTHRRVLLIFDRANRGASKPNIKTGELAVIESISPKGLPVIYGSELAEEKIRHYISGSEDNAFKKGFNVDAMVNLRSGKPVAYTVIDLHQVIDLPDP